MASSKCFIPVHNPLCWTPFLTKPRWKGHLATGPKLFLSTDQAAAKSPYNERFRMHRPPESHRRRARKNAMERYREQTDQPEGTIVHRPLAARQHGLARKLAAEPHQMPQLETEQRRRALDLAVPPPGAIQTDRPIQGEHGLALKGLLFNHLGECTMDPIMLRDACKCSKCIDPSTQQREFLFADIPTTIKAISQGADDDLSWKVAWENDIPGYSDHISEYSSARVKRLAEDRPHPITDIISTLPSAPWTKESIERDVVRLNHADFMNSPIALARILRGLHRDGLVFLSKVPSEPEAVAKIVSRIGPIRHTFYGTTWDVRSVVNANNVAYTSKYLGFHMDLLYMDHPPAFQFLHCIQNSCSGGESRFVDCSKASEIIRETQPQHVKPLEYTPVTYHYHNDGYYYRRRTAVWPRKGTNPLRGGFHDIFWSPPFMEDMGRQPRDPSQSISRAFMEASKAFADTLERSDLVFETKMEEGTCVIFDNLRVCHARNAFDTSDGQRWLRGAYMDRCDFRSKLMMLGHELEKLQQADLEQGQASGSEAR